MNGRQKGSSKAKNEGGTWEDPRYIALFMRTLTDKAIIIPLDDDVRIRIVLELKKRTHDKERIPPGE